MDKYNSLSDLQKELLSKGIIDLSGNTDEDMAYYVREALTRLAVAGNPDIEVRITSIGGNCGAGYGIYDLLSDYPGRTVGKVMGFANSMASIILQACDIRRISKHSTISLHYSVQNQVTWKQRKDPKEKRKFNARADKLDKQFLDAYAARAKISRDAIDKMLGKELTLDAQQALKFGLVDEILEPGKKTKRISEEAADGN